MKNSKQCRYVLGIDPSGNFNEGKGTTGWCVFDRQVDMFVACGVIRASKSNTQVEYWKQHMSMIHTIANKYKDVVVSMEDFILYSRQAKSQVNSAMETCQLIGVLKVYLNDAKIPLYMRAAVQVKQRWADSILYAKNYINKIDTHYFVDCKGFATCEHERDAMRHALHCSYFELDKENVK